MYVCEINCQTYIWQTLWEFGENSHIKRGKKRISEKTQASARRNRCMFLVEMVQPWWVAW